jgi:hypothetical protein
MLLALEPPEGGTVIGDKKADLHRNLGFLGVSAAILLEWEALTMMIAFPLKGHFIEIIPWSCQIFPSLW